MMKMLISKKLLYIDIETYSETDLKTCGVYKYADDPNFEIQLIGYAYNNDEVRIIDLAKGDKIPHSLLTDLTNEEVTKIAHNANFERTCLQAALFDAMPPEQWECTAVRASTLGLPRSLAAVGEVLGLKDDEKKMAEGKRLVQYFSKPCAPTNANGGRTRNLPRHEPERWELYKQYNIQDVVTERVIRERLQKYPTTIQSEKALWDLDQKMNEGGVLVETKMVNNILTYSDKHTYDLQQKAMEISGIDNPSSFPQIRRWLRKKNIDTDSLDKEAVKGLIEQLKDKEPTIVEFLRIRQELGKTSVTKYDAMARAICSDNRLRGMLQFYGANRTGRWAGKIVQLQNLPQNKFKDLDLARTLVLENDFDLLEILYHSMMDMFSQLIRTSFIARPGHTFIVADYSAIEARVIAWLANEKWRLDVFETHGKIYEASASQMLKVPIETITKDSPLRKKGKVAELALGYQGSVGALEKMGAKEMGLTEEEMQSLVNTWRAANKRIVALWGIVENAARDAILNPGSTIQILRDIRFKMIEDTLFIKLPNGRCLAYQGAEVKKSGYKQEIRYMGQNQTTQKWERVPTYGGKLTENITQAVARDCLGAAMLQLENAGYRPQFHVHDEVIIEVGKDTANTDMERIKAVMALHETWTTGLTLTADAYKTEYYMKD